jgi:hypothetical protein
MNDDPVYSGSYINRCSLIGIDRCDIDEYEHKRIEAKPPQAKQRTRNRIDSSHKRWVIARNERRMKENSIKSIGNLARRGASRQPPLMIFVLPILLYYTTS